MRKTLIAITRRLLPSVARSHRIWSGPLRGQRIVTSWHDYPRAILGRAEPQLVAWLQEHVKFGETWLDVGASYGYTMLALAARVGPQGRVYALEPMPATIGALYQTVRINQLQNVTILPLALSSKPQLQVERVGVIMGMADRTVAARAAATEPMLSIGFDALWPQMCGDNDALHGIKIDVQGMEIDVLAGMLTTIAAHRPTIVIEIHDGVDRHRLAALLSSVGYSLPTKAIEETIGGRAIVDKHELNYVCVPDPQTRRQDESVSHR